MPQRILAVETPGDLVRAAVAERTWNSIHLTGVFEEARRPDETGLSEALKRLLEKTGKPDVVISAMPGEFVVKRLLELPFNDLRRLNQTVPFALEEHLPFAVEDAVVAFARAGRGDAGTLVVAALVRKADLRSHLELLAGAGLDPRTVTLSELATARLLASEPSAASSAHLLLTVEAGTTSIVLVDSEGRLRALRTVQAGIAPGGADTPARGGVASIVGAARQTLLAHSSEVQRPDVVMAGAGAALDGLRSEIAQSLGAPVREAGEFAGPSMLNGDGRETARFSGCVAMVLGESPGASSETVNFRQSEFAFRGRIRGDFTPFYTSAILAGVVLVLMLVNFALGIAGDLSQLHSLDRAIAAISEPALGPNPPDNAIEALRARIVRMSKRLALMGGGDIETSPLDALLTISRNLPKRFPVEMEDLTIDASGIKLDGRTDSFGTVDQMKRALSRARYFGTIEVAHAKASSDGKVDFQLNVSFKDTVAGAR